MYYRHVDVIGIENILQEHACNPVRLLSGQGTIVCHVVIILVGTVGTLYLIFTRIVMLAIDGGSVLIATRQASMGGYLSRLEFVRLN